MGWREVLGLERAADEGVPLPRVPPAVPRHRFAVGSDYETWQALVAGTSVAGRVSRLEASRVPAVKRARDLIAGVIGTLPLQAFNAAGDRVEHALLEQPERLSGLVRSVTVARTVEDLLYDGASLWLTVQRTTQGFPAVVQRVEYGAWSQDVDTGVIRVSGREVAPENLTLFTSPCDPLLVAGAPAIRNIMRLEATASLYAETPEPSSYFTPSPGEPDPADDAEIEALLAQWQAARKARAVAFVPSTVELRSVTRMSADELQLQAARDFSVGEICRLTGIEPSWMGLSTTSRTYSNIVDERRTFCDYVLSPYLRAVEERLSLGDVTPRSQKVRFALDSFMRANTGERYAAHKTALDAGFLTLNEVRDLENRPPLPEAEDTAEVTE